MIPLICRVLFFQGDKKINCFGNIDKEKKIAHNGGVRRRAKSTGFMVLTYVGGAKGARGAWALVCSYSPYPCKLLR